MSISDFFKKENRTSIIVGDAALKDRTLAGMFGYSNYSTSGMRVDATTAMSLSACYACVRILSTLFASIPLNVFKREPGGGRTKAYDHPLYSLLREAPNAYQTPYEFFQMWMMCLLLRGDFFAEIIFTDRGVMQLMPRHPDYVKVFSAPDGMPAYSYSPPSGQKRIILHGEMLHVKFMSSDGINGITPISAAMNTFGGALAAEEFGQRYWSNGAAVGGVLQTKEKLSQQTYDRLLEGWTKRQGGAGNAHRTAILESGVEWKPITVSNKDSQFLESRKDSVGEIARMFGIPSHFINSEKASSWGTGLQEMTLGFLVYSMSPYQICGQQAVMRDVFTPESRKDYYCEFDQNYLLRLDTSARTSLYKELYYLGAINTNEIRTRENMNPIDGGDTYFVQSNMTRLEDMSASLTQQQDQPEIVRQLSELEAVKRLATKSAKRRVRTAEINGIKKLHDKCCGDMRALEISVSEFYESNDNFISSTLSDIIPNADDAKRFVLDYKRSSMSDIIEALKSDDVHGMLEKWRNDNK